MERLPNMHSGEVLPEEFLKPMNIKFFRFVILLSLACMEVSAQDCDCLSQFLFIKNYIEANNPAFQKIKSNYDEFEHYNKQVRIITDLAKEEQSTDRCVLHMEDYFLLLKDNHSGIGLNITRQPIDLNSQSSIQAKPSLIIDLRDNGGGAEECYIDLLKYLCTKPLTIDPADVWVSPDNIRKYENEGHPEELIERMKNARPFTFIPLTQNAITRWEIDGTGYPERIALIFNKKTASSAEGMIIYAMQSDKVITLGENSGGYLGYGNVKTEMVPCGKYIINSTTTMYSEKSKFEFIGITPQIKLKPDQDWVKSAITVLQKK